MLFLASTLRDLVLSQHLLSSSFQPCTSAHGSGSRTSEKTQAPPCSSSSELPDLGTRWGKVTWKHLSQVHRGKKPGQDPEELLPSLLQAGRDDASAMPGFKTPAALGCFIGTWSRLSESQWRIPSKSQSSKYLTEGILRKGLVLKLGFVRMRYMLFFK